MIPKLWVLTATELHNDNITIIVTGQLQRPFGKAPRHVAFSEEDLLLTCAQR